MELAKKITNKNINEMYDESLKCGALGGKILGAGGRGYLMLICPLNKQKKIFDKFRNFELVWNQQRVFLQRILRLIELDGHRPKQRDPFLN